MTGRRDDARGYDREELNADNRRKVMDVWKRFESSKTGVWLSRHTHLLERLSDEESHLVVRAGAMVCVFALILSMIMFLLVKGGMLAWTLLTLPVFAIAFMLVMVLWIFWDAYRDSGERAADWLSTRPGVATWRQIAADYGPRAVNRDVLPSVLPRMLEDFRYRKPGAIRPRPWHAAWYVGDSWNMEVWLGSERHIYVLGPTRSGKTVSVVIPSVVEAPGFVLATSTRGDIIKTTRYLRECGVKAGDRRVVWWPWRGHHAHLRPGRHRGERSGHTAQHALDAIAGLRRSGRRDAPRADHGRDRRHGKRLQQPGVGRERHHVRAGHAVRGGDRGPYHQTATVGACRRRPRRRLPT